MTLDWLRRKDPGLAATRRSGRVTAAACVGFYGCRYGLGDPIMATYAIFGTLALGALSRVPGPPRRRARSLVAALPAACVLVTAGTLLAVHTVAAAAGMFVVGFAVAYSGVGGPTLVGLANGLQLLYMLPCFPVYAPGTLGSRLIGVTLGVGLLAAAELALWPDPAPPRYGQRLAGAAVAVARYVEAVADALSRDALPGDRDRDRDRDGDGGEAAGRWPGELWEDTRERAEAIRPSRLPPDQRPVSADRRDRALSHAGASVRHVLARAHRLEPAGGATARPPPRAPGAGHLLYAMADALRSGAAALRGEGPAVAVEDLDRDVAQFDTERVERHSARPLAGPDLPQARAGSLALDVAEGCRFFVKAVRIARGAPIPPDDTPPGERPGSFWYAYASTPKLWWRRFRGHLTPRSVYFQSALRTAAALAVARLVAGAFDLQHGFWVLLATLTLMRTSAADTRTYLRPAFTGTLAGAVAAGLLLLLKLPPGFFIAVLPLVMLVAFVVGPVLGLAWMQAMFTLVVAMIFSQLTPANWQLAEARVIDVVVGGVVGAVIGVLAWPRGGGGELRRAVADYLVAAARTARETTATLAGVPPAPGTMARARHEMFLVEASYAQYQTERPDPRMKAVDWQATMVAGHRMVLGSESILRRCPPGSLAPWPAAAARLEALAAEVEAAYQELAGAARAGSFEDVPALSVGAEEIPERLPSAHWDGAVARELFHVVDAEVWLTGLQRDLAHLVSPAAGTARAVMW